MAKSFLYTRTGDAGTTALRGGVRVAKNSLQVEAYGTIDELNSFVGLVEAHVAALGPACEPRYRALLRDVAERMFDIGAYLSSPFSDASQPASPVDEADIRRLEEAIDSLDETTPPQQTFVLPGGCVAAAHAQVARAVCRRAERRLLTLADSGVALDPAILVYINRLSDLLFILGRYLNHVCGVADIPWHPRQK